MTSTGRFDNTHVEKHIALVRKIKKEAADSRYPGPIEMCLEQVPRGERIIDYIFLPNNKTNRVSDPYFALLTNKRLISLDIVTNETDLLIIRHHLFSDLVGSSVWPDTSLHWSFYFHTGSFDVNYRIQYEKLDKFYDSLRMVEDRILEEPNKRENEDE